MVGGLRDVLVVGVWVVAKVDSRVSYWFIYWFHANL